MINKFTIWNHSIDKIWESTILSSDLLFEVQYINKCQRKIIVFFSIDFFNIIKTKKDQLQNLEETK